MDRGGFEPPTSRMQTGYSTAERPSPETIPTDVTGPPVQEVIFLIFNLKVREEGKKTTIHYTK